VGDDPQHPTPSGGLVPDLDDETNINRLKGDTPDTFDAEIPEEGVYFGDTEFEQELEDDESDRYGEAG
jgi:hypothetical protein